MTWRAEVERRSVGPLRRLSALPRWAVVVGVLAVLLAGLVMTGPISVVPLLSLALFLGWLLLLSWPTLAPGARLLRLAVLAGLVWVAVSRL